METGDPRCPETEHRIYRVTLQKGELRGDLRFTSPERPFLCCEYFLFLIVVVGVTRRCSHSCSILSIFK